MRRWECGGCVEKTVGFGIVNRVLDLLFLLSLLLLLLVLVCHFWSFYGVEKSRCECSNGMSEARERESISS